MPEKTRKTAVLFDVDDTLYDQTVPFKEAYAEYFGAEPAVPADVIYPVTRKYSDRVYSRAMAGEITMEEMYIYRVQKAFDEFDISITDKEALDFQKIYADRQRHIHMSPLMEEILSFCSERAELKKGIIAFSPLAQGLLTNRYLNGIPEDSRIRTDGRFLKKEALTEEKLQQIRNLNGIAAGRGQTLAEMALSWVLRDGIVTSVLVGASRPQQVVDNVKAIENLEFTEEELKKIEEVL